MDIHKINDIEIKPITRVKKKNKVIPDPLCDPHAERPFLYIISSKTGSGKSVLISNILKNIYYHYFNNVYFCSSNVDNGMIYDVAYDKVKISDKRIFDTFNEEIMEYIVNDIRSDEDFEDSQYLLIIDDLPTELNKRTSKIVKHFLKHRHIHLSIIIVTQKLNLLNTAIRGNATHLISFFTNNKKERETMTEMTDNDNFLKYLDYATQEPYNFLFVDLLKNPAKFYKNFNFELKINDN